MNKYYEIGKSFYLIRSEEKEFHRNICLKKMEANGVTKSMIFDPGTRLDLSYLLPILDELIGGVKNLDYIFLSHQDPDVTSNVGMLLNSAPKSLILSSVDTWRLIKMYGLPSNRFLGVESFNSDQVKLKDTGHRFKFIPAYFAHFKGAMMCYDYESGILFSGDFMGGVNSREGEGCVGNEDSWKGISMFHQIYMPSSKALEKTILRIGKLESLPHKIVPQHGDILEGDFVNSFLNRMLDLKVGMELIDDDESKELSIMGVNSFLDVIKQSRPQFFRKVSNMLLMPGNFTTYMDIIKGQIVDIKVKPEDALEAFFAAVLDLAEADKKDEIKGVIYSSLSDFGVYVPESVSVKDSSIIDSAGHFE